MTVEWIGTDGQIINQQHDDITVNGQSTVSNVVTRSLVFDPLKMAHGGGYVCRATLTLPGSAGVFQNVGEYQLSVLSKTLAFYRCDRLMHIIYVTDMTFIQLKFGPVPHCSMWYEDKVNYSTKQCWLTKYSHNNSALPKHMHLCLVLTKIIVFRLLR